MKVLCIYDLHTYPYYTGHSVMIEVSRIEQLEDEFEKQMMIRERRREFTSSPQPTIWRMVRYLPQALAFGKLEVVRNHEEAQEDRKGSCIFETKVL